MLLSSRYDLERRAKRGEFREERRKRRDQSEEIREYK